MRLFFATTTLIMLVSVQAFGTVCKTKCSIQGHSFSELSGKSKQALPSCHSNKNNENTKSDDSENCGDICNADELFSDLKTWELEKPIQNFSVALKFSRELITFEQDILISKIWIPDPPGMGFYSGVAIFIQKSSYLI